MYKVLNPLYTSVFNNGLPNNNKHNYLWDLWLLVKNFKAQWSSQQQQAQRTVPLDLAAARLVKTKIAYRHLTVRSM